MSQGYALFFREGRRRVYANIEEGIVFLAAIIPKKYRFQIRMEIEKDPEFYGKHHFFLGMKVRNALRMGGFSYDPFTLDCIWFSWLKEAVCLPEDKIILTDAVKQRIKRYQAGLKPSRE